LKEKKMKPSEKNGFSCWLSEIIVHTKQNVQIQLEKFVPEGCRMADWAFVHQLLVNFKESTQSSRNVLFHPKFRMIRNISCSQEFVICSVTVF
jgi:hypothetical protein